MSRLGPSRPSTARRRRRAIVQPVVAAVLAGACGGASGVAPAASAPPGVTVDLKESTYDVRGDDVRTLWEEMRMRGPQPSFARFDWRLEASYAYGPPDRPSGEPEASSEGGCELKELDIRLHFTTTVPRRVHSVSAPDELVERWETYQRNLRVHRDGHLDIALGAAAEVQRRYRDLRTSDCDVIRREARRVLEAVIEKWNRRSREYDRTTGHGRTQGVMWPPPARHGGSGGGAAGFR